MPKKILTLIVVGLMMASGGAFAAQEAPGSTTAKPLPLRQLRFFALGPRTGRIATHMQQLSLPAKTAAPSVHPSPLHPQASITPAATALSTPAAPMTQEQAKQMLSIFPDAH